MELGVPGGIYKRVQNKLLKTGTIMKGSMRMRIMGFCLFLLWSGRVAYGQTVKTDTKTLLLTEFRGINLGINAVVLIRQGEFQEVVAQGPEALLQEISLEVKDGIWDIRYTGRTQSVDTIKINIVVKRLTSLAIGGSGAIISDRPLKLSTALEISLGGSGSIELDGTGPELRVNLAGSGKINLEGLEVQKAVVSVAGAGEARLTVINTLEASIAGSGKVWYNGPAQVRSSVAGSGFVRQIN
jgi:hypothetical protein